MDKKHEEIKDPKLFYCFVNIREDLLGYSYKFFIVPSAVVAKYVREQHELWLQDDSTHHGTSRRQFRIGLPNERKITVPAPLAEKYENNWEFKM